MAYSKHTWEYGEEFTPSKMNNLEEGISDSYCVKSVPVANSRSATATFNGTIYFMLFVYSNADTRSGVYFGRHANGAITGSWVIAKGANLNLELNGSSMTISSTSSVQSRADLVFLRDFEERVVYE